MTDAEAQRLVLQRLYEIRLSNPNATPKDFRGLPLGGPSLLRIMDQLAQLNLISWLPHSNAKTGVTDHFANAHITAPGVRSIEEGMSVKAAPASTNSQNVIDFGASQKQFLDTLKERLIRVENGEVFESEHSGPYTADEKAKAIYRLKELIRSVEEENATSPIVPLTGVAAKGEAGSFAPSLSVPLRGVEATLGGAGSLTVDATVVSAPTTARSAFELRLSDRPSDIRDAAHTLATAITDQIEKLQAAKPNDEHDLAKHNEYVGFLEKLANGLKELADALDRVAAATAKGSSEPIFLGTAGNIAEQLSIDIKEWFERHHADGVDFFMTVGVFAAGYDFLAACGVQGGVAAIVSGLLTKSFSKKKSQK